MNLLGYARVYFGLPYRQTEGLIRTYGTAIPAVPDYTAIHKRINRLDLKHRPTAKLHDIVLVADSSGIKLTNRGEWRRHKWHLHRGFLKIHVGVDVSTKEVLALKVTDERSSYSKQLKGLVRQAAKHGTISKLIGDGAYDSRDIFSFLDDRGIIPAIKIRRNSSHKSRGCYSRKMAVISQLADYSKWCDSVSYGKRWIVESAFSAIKRMFGEEVRSRKRRNMIQEMNLKILLYNQFMTS
jgi:hypothetical protein